jgi:hypothetical protein
VADVGRVIVDGKAMSEVEEGKSVGRRGERMEMLLREY